MACISSASITQDSTWSKDGWCNIDRGYRKSISLKQGKYFRKKALRNLQNINTAKTEAWSSF
jgi:hypothetical protein